MQLLADATERALACLDVSALEAFLQQLVRTPSVYRAGVAGANEEAVARLVADLLRTWGWTVQWEVAAPGRPCLVADLPGTLGAGPLLLFEGHTDVVTPGDLSAWQYDPFGGQIVGRRLYGRGACDMKGGLCAMLFAARAIQLAGSPFKGRLRLLIPADEEGLMLGIKHLVAQGYADGAMGCIVCEPEGGELCLAQKGSLRLHLLAHGRIAHGAMPQTGVNALAGMVRWLSMILELEAELNARYGPHPLLGPTYLSPTIARAPLAADPTQLNCLPDYCDAFLDIRTVPALDHTLLISQIAALGERARVATPGLFTTVEVVDDRPPTELCADHQLAQAVTAAHTAVYAAPPQLGGVPGSTDGTIIARECGVPVLVYGPGDKWLPHQPDEYVDLDEVGRAAQVYIRAALALLG